MGWCEDEGELQIKVTVTGVLRKGLWDVVDGIEEVGQESEKWTDRVKGVDLTFSFREDVRGPLKH